MNECDSETWFDRLLFSRKGPFQLKNENFKKKADFAEKILNIKKPVQKMLTIAIFSKN